MARSSSLRCLIAADVCLCSGRVKAGSISNDEVLRAEIPWPSFQAAGIITASTVNGRKRRISNSANVTANGVNPSSYPRMENSSNLSQSMDSVNTASGEEEVGTN